MVPTLVIRCSHCGGLLLAKADQKTRSCPLCNAKINLEKTRALCSAETAHEASVILRKMKLDAATKRSDVRP